MWFLVGVCVCVCGLGLFVLVVCIWCVLFALFFPSGLSGCFFGVCTDAKLSVQYSLYFQAAVVALYTALPRKTKAQKMLSSGLSGHRSVDSITDFTGRSFKFFSSLKKLGLVILQHHAESFEKKQQQQQQQQQEQE